MSVTSYTALAMQAKCHAINHFKTRKEVLQSMKGTLDRLDFQIFGAKKFIGPHLKLVVLPEYFMTSYPMGESISEWREKACITQNHEIFDRIGDICKKHDIYFSGNYYEQDTNFPDLFFQASFIINDAGQMILNYRRLNSMYSPTPHDVLDRYLELYGKDSLFPVVGTPLGKLACIASEEILFPEVARCLMMRGAEVFLHSSSEKGSPLITRKNIAKRARAVENLAYIISANSGGIANHPILENSTDGGSQIVHFDGHLLCAASPGESVVAHGTVDISALRSWRNTVGMKNYVARQRFELYADSYKNYSHYPSNLFLDQKPEKALFRDAQEAVIKRLYS